MPSGFVRRAYERAPERLKRAVGTVVAYAPARVVYGRSYADTASLMARSDTWTQAEHEAWQLDRLRGLLAFASRDVPYYRRIFAEAGFDPTRLRCLSDLAQLPLLTRDMVRELGTDLVPDNVAKSRYRYQTTGGTSGKPLGFYVAHAASAAEWAFISALWGRVGYRRHDRRVVLRGRAIAGRESGRLWEHDPITSSLVFSSFDMSEKNLPAMVERMRSYRPAFLHAYPSSATILASHLSRTGERLTSLRGVLLGSENFAESQRTYLEEVFGVRVFSWYGHSEKCVLAGECERDVLYHPIPEYGVTELVDDASSPVLRPGDHGTIVGTSFVNTEGTIFIRYLTDDSAMWVDEACPCGRPGRRLSDVRGRWTQEFLVGADGTVIPITAVNLHTRVYATIERFRFSQTVPGEARFEYVPGPSFSAADEADLSQEIHRRLGGRVDVAMVQVADIMLTSSGKHRFVDQKIALDDADATRFASRDTQKETR